MTLTPSQPDNAPALGTICLRGHATTVTAEDLQAQLVAAADYSEATTIDASDLLSVGQAVLQLLIAARTEASASFRNFTYVGVSPEFTDRVVSCQLADATGLAIAKDVVQ